MSAKSDPLELQAAYSVDAAEHYCAALARREAKNFYWGFIALPRAQRMAIYALYSFAREVDDEADRPDGERDPARLAWHRDRLRRCLAGDYVDPVMQALGPAIARYQIPAAELAQVIDGVELDLHQNRYQSWEELRAYCRLVASAVGRMCVRVFGFTDPRALVFADDLGQAMQLTNILRDIREDYFLFGRIYLPLGELARFGIDEARLVAALHGTDGRGDGRDGDAWGAFVRSQAERAEGLFASGLQVASLIPTSSAVCVLTMAGIYQGILQRIKRHPYLPLQRRVSLSPAEKLGVVVRAWLQAR
ncbi:MAG TPA: squalene/phytoene synthase family protein [Chloroflexota bacterium]|nr:squalene/phytoene synthase family protein [Chloroflexota bacterium]